MDTTNKGFSLCDMHSHMLPVGGVDDGCKDFQETIQLLHQASQQGIDALVFTPHYYHTESIEAFIHRRDSAQKTLEQMIPEIQNQFKVPDLYYGAEVLFQPRMSRWDELGKLCICGTNYLMLELPFDDWNDSIFDDISFMVNNRGIRIIIAHLDRYVNLVNKKMLKRLLALQGNHLLIQMNSDYILQKPRKAKKWMKTGIVDLLGSDAHDPQKRPESLGDAAAMIRSWGMEDVLQEIGRCSEGVLNR